MSVNSQKKFIWDYDDFLIDDVVITVLGHIIKDEGKTQYRIPITFNLRELYKKDLEKDKVL